MTICRESGDQRGFSEANSKLKHLQSEVKRMDVFHHLMKDQNVGATPGGPGGNHFLRVPGTDHQPGILKQRSLPPMLSSSSSTMHQPTPGYSRNKPQLSVDPHDTGWDQYGNMDHSPLVNSITFPMLPSPSAP